MTFVLGVDGGGTGSRAVILDGGGAERGRGEGPPALVERSRERGASAGGEPSGSGDPDEVASAVATAARAAARAAGISLPVDHLCAGLAGAGSVDAREEVRHALEPRRISRRIIVVTDADAAFHDAFPREESGILLVCGTGSIALGRAPDGRIARAGGWGPLLDDAGSGYRIGLKALSAALRSHDGRGPESRLTELALGSMGASEPPDLVVAARRAPKHRIAALAPGVVELAEEGDGVAEDIVREAVEELSALVRALLARLGGAESGEGSRPSRPPIALHGGLVAPGRPLRSLLRRSLEDRALRVLERPVDPARGAGRLALEAFLRSES